MISKNVYCTYVDEAVSGEDATVSVGDAARHETADHDDCHGHVLRILGRERGGIMNTA